MLVARIAKTAMLAAIAGTATLVVFDNVTDYPTNFAFVRHVLAMDTIFPDSGIGYRAITNPALHHAAYAIIIAAEAMAALMCWIGAVQLFGQRRASAGAFNGAKRFAIAGLTLGFLTWQFGFMGIGGEWFGMWQSAQWNGMQAAFRFAMVIVAVLIFVALPDEEVGKR